MENEKDKLFEQTPEQGNPYLAKAEDFEVENERLEGGGQRGDSLSEYKKLLDESSRLNSKSPLTGTSGKNDERGRQLEGKAPKSLNPSAIRK